MKQDVDRLSIEELKDTRQAWWDARFSEFLWRRLQQHEGDWILDIGCGIGTFFERMIARFQKKTYFIGVDLDYERLRIASQSINKEVYTSRLHFLAGDFNGLPLAGQSIDVAVTILTLQHLANPQRAIAEMYRVLKPKRFCLCVEPDNTSQCIHLPMFDREFSVAISAFWDEVRKHYLPRDIALGPSLPFLLTASGYKVKNIDTFLITRYSQERAELFVKKTKNNFLYVGEKYGIRKDSLTMMALLRVLDKIEQTSRGVEEFYSLSTIPLFLVRAIKE